MPVAFFSFFSLFFFLFSSRSSPVFSSGFSLLSLLITKTCCLLIFSLSSSFLSFFSVFFTFSRVDEYSRPRFFFSFFFFPLLLLSLFFFFSLHIFSQERKKGGWAYVFFPLLFFPPFSLSLFYFSHPPCDEMKKVDCIAFSSPLLFLLFFSFCLFFSFPPLLGFRHYEDRKLGN